MEKNKVLVTGAAGFIGFHLCKKLLEKGFLVAGYDNLNSYYDLKLKKDRLSILKQFENFQFFRGNLENRTNVYKLFETFKPVIVVHLAAQAGVRFSIENPKAYLSANVDGFFSILEACRSFPIEHLIFASSSSVYGNQKKTPFSENDQVDQPISFYAATKKANELMAYSYANVYKIPVTGLRFFTVYGPYGRPDMAYFSFTKAIFEGQPIKLFNYGNLSRDFTYIDDVTKAIMEIIERKPKVSTSNVPYNIYNIGNNHPEQLKDFLAILEDLIGKKAIVEYLPMQQGDVLSTFADVTKIENDYNFSPSTCLKDGLASFVKWYSTYYQK